MSEADKVNEPAVNEAHRSSLFPTLASKSTNDGDGTPHIFTMPSTSVVLSAVSPDRASHTATNNDAQSSHGIFSTAYSTHSVTDSATIPGQASIWPARLCMKSASMHRVGSTDQVKNPHTVSAVWPTYLHSVCMKLMMSIGNTELLFAPQLAWRFGGCVFFLPVILIALVATLPMHFLECVAGQYTVKSQMAFLPDLAPVLRGLGYGIFTLSILITTYYMKVCAWVVIYLFFSFRSNPPWHTCNPAYNTGRCFSEALQAKCDRTLNHTVYFEFQCMPADQFCTAHGFAASNGSHCIGASALTTARLARWVADRGYYKASAYAYNATSDVVRMSRVGKRRISQNDFFHFVRGERRDVTPAGTLPFPSPMHRHRHRVFALGYAAAWTLALLLSISLWAASWIAVVCMLVSPVLILLMMCRVLLFPGAWAGIGNFFYGRASLAHLLDSDCWVNAISMTFWSVSIGWGVNPTLSSRCRLRHNALTSSAVVVFCGIAFGILNSLLLFAVRGTFEQRSVEMRAQIRQIDDDTEAFVAVAFTAAVDLMPGSQFWGVIFFGVVAAQLVGAMAVFIIAVGLNLVDAVPYFARRPFHVAALTAFAPALVFGAVIVAADYLDIDWSVLPLIMLQWVVGSMILATVLGRKLSTPAFVAEMRDTLGIQLGVLRRAFVVSWLVVVPCVTTFQMVYVLSAYRPPPVVAGTLWLALVNSATCLVPPLAALATTVYVCSRTDVWTLFRTTQAFRPHPIALRELEPVLH